MQYILLQKSVGDACKSNGAKLSPPCPRPATALLAQPRPQSSRAFLDMLNQCLARTFCTEAWVTTTPVMPGTAPLIAGHAQQDLLLACH